MLLHFLFDEKQNNNNNNNNGRLYIFCLFVCFFASHFSITHLSPSLFRSPPVSYLRPCPPSCTDGWTSFFFCLLSAVWSSFFFPFLEGLSFFLSFREEILLSVRNNNQPTGNTNNKVTCAHSPVLSPLLFKCVYSASTELYVCSQKNQWNEDYEAKRERDTNKTKNDTNCLTVNRSFRFSFHPPFLI